MISWFNDLSVIDENLKGVVFSRSQANGILLRYKGEEPVGITVLMLQKGRLTSSVCIHLVNEVYEKFRKLFELYIKSDYGVEFLTEDEARLAVEYAKEILRVC